MIQDELTKDDLEVLYLGLFFVYAALRRHSGKRAPKVVERTCHQAHRE